MVRPSSSNIPRYVKILKERGLLDQRGAQIELARICGVSKQHIHNIVSRIEIGERARNTEGKP